MTLAPASPLDTPTALAGDRRLTQSQEDFSAVLARSRSTQKVTDLASAREVAGDFVAMALVQPILRQLRESEQTAPPFAPGPAEKNMRQVADASFARQMVRSARWPMLDTMARRLLEHAQRASTASTPAPDTDSPERDAPPTFITPRPHAPLAPIVDARA